jgi:hypothetical protein
MTDDIFKSMASQWGAPVVARAEVGKFSGGALSPKYCANQDSLGTGPKGRFKIGRRVVYRVDELVAWLREHSRAV